MKKTVFFFIALCVLISHAYGAEQKFGYVDLNRALNESRQGKKAIETLEEDVKKKQMVIDEKGSEIKSLEEEISKQSSVLTPQSIKEKKDKYDELLRDYQRMVEDSQKDIQKRQSEMMKTILNDLRKLIRVIGEEEHYSAIFEMVESGVLYVRDELDITDMVIERFSKAGSHSGGETKTEIDTEAETGREKSEAEK